MATSPDTATEVARIAGALWGTTLGHQSMTAVLAAVDAYGLTSVVNEAYRSAFGAVSHAAIATLVVSNAGITGATVGNAVAAVQATLDGAAPGDQGAALLALLDSFSGMTADATYGSFAIEFNSRVAAAMVYAATAGSEGGGFGLHLPGHIGFSLSTGTDVQMGSAGDDTFNARLVDGHSTLTTGDRIEGGAGHDTLLADMAADASSKVSPITTGVESLIVRAINIGALGATRVDVDAANMAGLTRIESNNSRADLVVEGVRLLDKQETKDLTVAVVQTDPGHVDMAVYLDPTALRQTKYSATGSTLSLQLMNTRSALADAANPLAEHIFTGLSISLDGVPYLIRDVDSSRAGPIGSATTYEALLLAIQQGLAANPALAHVTAAITGSFDALDTRSGLMIYDVGKVITLTNSGTEVLSGGLWFAEGGVPASSSELHTWGEAKYPMASAAALVTSTVVLDDVGRGAIGGDLVIGSLPLSDAANAPGVQRFEITVERSSQLEVLASTGNALREVQLVNGSTKGNFSAMGDSTPLRQAAGAAQNLPAGVSPEVHGAYAFTNVRLIDASQMVGAVAFNAQVTPAAFSKYAVPSGSSTNYTDFIIGFSYLGGAGSDSMKVVVDGSVAASQDTVEASMLAFRFDLNGGPGNDDINLQVGGALPGGGVPDWYRTQSLWPNITIEGGDGDDTVRTLGAGDKRIDLGAGDDTLYSDNTGVQAIDTSLAGVDYGNAGRAEWVLNTADQAAANAAARNVKALVSGNNDSHPLYLAVLTVSFHGMTSTAVVPSTNYRSDDLQINQAIQQAINTDPVLGKLLLAEAGPSSVLTVKSLIDGVQVAGDLTVSLAAAPAGTLKPAEVAAAAAAYGLPVGTTQATLLAAMGVTCAGLSAAGNDYASALANNGTTPLTGANSTSPASNDVSGGPGNDVIVLGTTAGASYIASSSETVVYRAAFGNDTIVHFTKFAAVVGRGGFGADLLDFNAIGGSASAGVWNSMAVPGAAAQGTVIPRQIWIDDRDMSASGNDTAAKVLALFTDSAVSVTVKQIYIVADAHNVATVYQIVDASGGSALAPNVSVNLMGTIDLADTAWSTMAAADFV